MAGWFGFAPAEALPVRRFVILAFSAVTLCRFVFMMFSLMHRAISFEEMASVPLAFAVYYVGFALLVLPSTAPLDVWDGFGIAVFALGAVFNTGGELQRKRFKADPANKGKLFTGGFFALSMHINFFGDVLWVAGYAIVARNLWGGLIPLFLLVFFASYNVVLLDRHLAAHYGEQFEAYRKRTKDWCRLSGNQTSRLATLSALSLMKSRRGSTRSPISWVKVSSATVAFLDLHLQQGADIGIERGFPKLLGIHLAQAFVALQREALARRRGDRGEQRERAVNRAFQYPCAARWQHRHNARRAGPQSGANCGRRRR